MGVFRGYAKAEHVEVSRGRRLRRQPGKTPDFYPTNQNCACEVYQKCFAQASSSRRLPSFFTWTPCLSPSHPWPYGGLSPTAHIIFLKPFISTSLSDTCNAPSLCRPFFIGQFLKSTRFYLDTIRHISYVQHYIFIICLKYIFQPFHHHQPTLLHILQTER